MPPSSASEAYLAASSNSHEASLNCPFSRCILALHLQASSSLSASLKAAAASLNSPLLSKTNALSAYSPGVASFFVNSSRKLPSLLEKISLLLSSQSIPEQVIGGPEYSPVETTASLYLALVIATKRCLSSRQTPSALNSTLPFLWWK